MQRSNTDVWVGLLVVVGAAALLFLAMQSANLLSISWQKTYEINALFDNIGGLKKQAAVKSAGVVVGRVQDIRFDDKSFQANVVMAMDVRYQFPKDSSLKILTSGLLGEANLAPGDKVQSTQSAVVLENLISRFLYNKASDAGSAPAGN
jgi:phospholipid/cholesterol/gamma-HCH transport system substrate-binding protein